MIVPKLALNFTTATLDPLISVSRAGNTATRINASGYVEVVNEDLPRFDYGAVTLACKGLLIEESKQNVITYSSDFANAAWALGAINMLAPSSNSETAPDNTLSADKLIPNGANSQHRYDRATTLAAGTNSFSIFVKDGGYGFVWLRFGSLAAIFNIATGAATGVVAGTTATTFALRDGWRYVSISGTTTAIPTLRINVVPSASQNDFSGDGTSGVYVWGAQVEAGTPTSYIPTTTTALTRNADVATITGTNFSSFWQAGRGGVSVSAIPSTVSGTRPLIQFDDNTADNLIALQGNTTNPELYIVDTATPQAQIDAGTIAARTPYTLTGWWQTDFCAARKDNGAKVIDNSATIPTVTQARLGSDGTNYLNGHLATINYYDQFSGQIYTRRKNKAVFSVL